MTPPSSILVFLLGSTLSTWLRFDRGAVVVSLVALLVTVAATLAVSVIEARRLPALVLPDAVRELEAKSFLTQAEERRFVAALREDHRLRQLAEWRQIERRGPGRLIGPRAAFNYFWACLCVHLIPPGLVPASLLPWAPRTALVLVSLAVAATALAVPFGLRDWARVLRAIEFEERGRA